MRNTWKSLLMVGTLVSFVVLLGVFNETKPRILVLHSAAQDSSWASAVDGGMRAQLQTNRRPVSVEWMYMNVAGPIARSGVTEEVASARRAIKRVDPDVLIAVDDEANQLVARDYAGRTSPRIIYVSLDRPPADLGYVGAANVSGVSEQLPFAAIGDAVRTMFPGRAPTVSAIGIDGPTGQAEMAQARGSEWGTIRLADTALVSTAGAWRDFVTAARSDALVVLSVQDLPEADGSAFSASDVIAWTQQNAKPFPIGTQIDFVPSGGGLSFSPPADDYGRKAVQLALDWLDERTTPGAPPAVQSPHFQMGVGQSALTARGVRLPSIYLEAARQADALYP